MRYCLSRLLMLGPLIFSMACAQDSSQTALPDAPVIPTARFRYNTNIDYTSEPVSFPTYQPDSLIILAKQYIGTPYKANGKLPGGFDCSGFTFFLHRQYGIYLPFSSADMASIGIEVDTDEAQPGDLIFFKGENKGDTHAGHVGIVVSRTGEPLKFIHSSTSRGVRYDFVETNPYFKPRFMFIRRIVNG